MLTIILGFVALIVGAIIAGWCGAVSVVVITAILICMPLDGYEDRELAEEIPLLKLNRPITDHKVCYAEKHKQKVIVAYDNSGTYDVDFVAYEEKTLVGIIKIYESEQCTEPVLRVFESSAMREVWSFCFFKRIEYVLLLPKDTLVYKHSNKTEHIDVIV